MVDNKYTYSLYDGESFEKVIFNSINETLTAAQKKVEEDNNLMLDDQTITVAKLRKFKEDDINLKKIADNFLDVFYDSFFTGINLFPDEFLINNGINKDVKFKLVENIFKTFLSWIKENSIDLHVIEDIKIFKSKIEKISWIEKK